MNKFFIDYLNADKDFMEERKFFTSYRNAEKWGRKEFEKFHPDMIINTPEKR
jgi:hypothetical protein